MWFNVVQSLRRSKWFNSGSKPSAFNGFQDLIILFVSYRLGLNGMFWGGILNNPFYINFYPSCEIIPFCYIFGLIKGDYN